MKFCFGDALNPPSEILQPEEYDAVIALDVFEHIHRPKKFLGVTKTALQGNLMLLTPNGVDLAKRIQVLFGRPYGFSVQNINSEGPFTSHVKEYTHAELKEILRLNGFEPINSEFFNQSAQKYDKRSNDWTSSVVRHSYELATRYNS